MPPPKDKCKMFPSSAGAAKFRKGFNEYSYHRKWMDEALRKSDSAPLTSLRDLPPPPPLIKDRDLSRMRLNTENSTKSLSVRLRDKENVPSIASLARNYVLSTVCNTNLLAPKFEADNVAFDSSTTPSKFHIQKLNKSIVF